MLLNLIVRELEHLQPIWICRLSSFSLRKVVDYSLVSISLLDIIIVEVYYCISIWEYFSLYPIVKYNLFLAILIDSLNLTIITYDLFNHFHV